MTHHRQITFVEDLRPPLAAGLYEITVTQQVQVQNEPHEFSETKSVAVQGERFRIPSKEIHAVFPPPDGKGEYLNCLPHVIFNRANLPWLRDLNTHPRAPSWLAVLLFDAGEAPQTQSLQVKDLVPSGWTIQVPGEDAMGHGEMGSGYISYPFNPITSQVVMLDYGESTTSGVQAIDIPAELFNRIAPTEQDMPYLAHAREVHTAGMAEGVIQGGRSLTGLAQGGLEDPEVDLGTFSVVVGNRTPSSSGSTAVLVSLEGLGSILPDGASRLPAGTTHVRLISLYSWTFTATSGASAFASHLKALNKNPDGTDTVTEPRLPGVPPSSTEVQAALQSQASGALNEHDAEVLVRNAFAMGYTAMPHHTRSGDQAVSWYRGPFRPDAPSRCLTAPLPYADAATHYNPQTGMLDVSYSAAWQLGQLLALKNKIYSTALYEWRQTMAQEDQVQLETSLLSDQLETVAQQGKAGDSALHHAFVRFFKHACSRESEDHLAPPPAVMAWLQDLALLKGIPFEYLIPEPKMLPPESLRFFYLDQDWILALIDGALSLGRKSANDPLAKAVLERLNLSTASVSGYLLRSGTVIGWPGMKIKAYAGWPDHDHLDSAPTITATHFQRVSADLVVAYFSDVLSTLAFEEPREALHFGIEAGPVVNLRSLTAGSGHQPGQETGATAAVTMRGADQRTLDVHATAQTIAAALANASPFTSAEFALEMIKVTNTVVFQRPRP